MPTVKPLKPVMGYKKPGKRFNVSFSPRHGRKKLVSIAEIRPWVPQIDRLQNGFGLNQIEFATRLMKCAPRSLILWKSRRTPNPAVLIRLNELHRLYQALAQLMPADEIGPWMKRTNEYLDPLTPLEVLDRGEIDRLWHIIHNVGSGMPT